MAADKARFYLEQSLPELREYEKKKVFTTEEIQSITKKRSDFEHRVNASGPKPADFARYAEYEMNLELLRRKRVKRLGIRARTHYGQRRIFFVLDRATRKFPGELGLWMQYIEFAKKEKASNVLAKALSSVLKLHPSKPELWIYAAKHAMDENADMTEARSYMQRGLRFNKKSKLLWLEYAKLEMVFVAKVLARRMLLGIDRADTTRKLEGEKEEDDESILSLPTITAEDMDPTLKTDKSLDSMALENVDTNPALNGAIAIAIFDSAMAEVPKNVDFAAEFFELFAGFTHLKCCERLLEHVVKYTLDNISLTSPLALWLSIKVPLVGVSVSDPIFPSRVGTMLSNMTEALSKTDNRTQLYQSFVEYVFGILKKETDLDPAIKKVFTSTAIKYLKQADQEHAGSPDLYALWADLMVWRGKPDEARAVLDHAVKKVPGDKALVAKLGNVKS